MTMQNEIRNAGSKAQNERPVDRLVQHGQSVAPCIDEDAGGDAGHVQEPGDQRRERDLDVGLVEQCGDDEGGKSQHRRHDLAGGARSRLDGARHRRAVALFLHHRNGQPAGEHDVGDRRAHDRGDDAAADDGGKGGAADETVAAQPCRPPAPCAGCRWRTARRQTGPGTTCCPPPRARTRTGPRWSRGPCSSSRTRGRTAGSPATG